MTHEEYCKKELIAEHNPDALLADGFDDAIIGIGNVACSQPVVVYDKDTCVNILVDRDGMSEEDAWEYLDYNTFGAYVGENSPIFITKLENL